MTKYLTIAVVILTLLLVGAGKLYLMKVEEFGALEKQFEFQRGETKKAIAQIEGLKKEHAAQIEKFTLLQGERRKDAIRYEKDLARISALRKSTERAALKEPERFGSVATFRLRRGLRDVCRSGGGTPAECKILVPKSRKARAGGSPEPDAQDDDRVGEGGGGGEGEDIGAGVYDTQRQP